MQRDRSEGWRHAKASGHENEQLVRRKLMADRTYSQVLARRLNKGASAVRDAVVGGIREPGVYSVLGDRTKSKTDLKIDWDDGSTSRISIKKSGGGQVFLIGVERFLRGYEKHYEPVPAEVVRGISLLFGSADDTVKVLKSGLLSRSVTEKVRKYEIRKRRLVWRSLEVFDAKIARETLNWLQSSAGRLAEFCFSRGLAAEPEEWASHIWYVNLLGDEPNHDILIDVARLTDACDDVAASETAPGVVNFGSTLRLPFGFVQWHKGQMQFHHSVEKVRSLLKI